MTLDKYKTQLLVNFFKIKGIEGWQTIANELIINEKCIVPAWPFDVWKGGIGNFINYNRDLPNHINCVEYQFNVDEFISSMFFQDSLPGHINAVTQEIKSLKQQLEEKEEQLKSIKELEYEKIP